MKTKRFVSTLLALLLVCSLPVSAFADTVDDNLADTTVSEIATGDTMGTNSGTVITNNGTVTTNSSTGTVTINYGTVTTNKGTVTTNNGTVEENGNTVETNNNCIYGNEGTVTTNNGTVDYNPGTVDTNNGTVATNNFAVGTNNGTVSSNRGEVTTNSSSGTVTTNNKTVGTNYGTVDTNEGTVGNNNGTVTTNNGTVDNNGCIVETNNGYISANEGEVKTNNGTVGTNVTGVIINNGTVTDNDNVVRINNTTGTVINVGGVVLTNYGTVKQGDTTWYGVLVDNDGEKTLEEYCTPGQVLDFSQLTKEGYVYAGYTQEYQLLNGVLTKQALTVSDTSYTVTCPNVLTLIWQAIFSPAADDGTGSFGPGSFVSINGHKFLLVAVMEDVYCLASVDSFGEEQLSDLPALLSTLLTEGQLTHVTGEPELLDEELTARFFGGEGSHIVFPCDSSLIFS